MWFVIYIGILIVYLIMLYCFYLSKDWANKNIFNFSCLFLFRKVTMKEKPFKVYIKLEHIKMVSHVCMPYTIYFCNISHILWGKDFKTKLLHIYVLPLHVFPVPQKGFSNFESNFLKATKQCSCVFDTLYLYFSTCC